VKDLADEQHGVSWSAGFVLGVRKVATPSQACEGGFTE